MVKKKNELADWWYDNISKKKTNCYKAYLQLRKTNQRYVSSNKNKKLNRVGQPVKRWVLSKF